MQLGDRSVSKDARAQATKTGGKCWFNKNGQPAAGGKKEWASNRPKAGVKNAGERGTKPTTTGGAKQAEGAKKPAPLGEGRGRGGRREHTRGEKAGRRLLTDWGDIRHTNAPGEPQVGRLADLFLRRIEISR